MTSHGPSEKPQADSTQTAAEKFYHAANISIGLDNTGRIRSNLTAFPILASDPDSVAQYAIDRLSDIGEIDEELFTAIRAVAASVKAGMEE